jgi:tetratricopeptide (TPR) repeat protein/predicted phosphodiesterase
VGITWLHISDFHVRSGDPYDRDVVLGALVKSAAEYRHQGRSPDLIFATGDIAHSGKPQEYELAEKFFDDLLSAVDLPKERLFVIPGNHDVDRDLGIGLARTLDSREEADKYFHPDRPHPHLTQKLDAYLKWHNRYFAGIRAAPGNSTCALVDPINLNGHRLGILLVNSALFCQDDEDHARLCVGRRCLQPALVKLNELNADLKIALIHHPLEWLNPIEASNIQAELESSVDILLRGHLHEARIESIASPEGESLRCAAGAAYQSRKWPNRAFYATFHGSELTLYPIRYEDAPRPIWTTDPSVFPRDRGHEKSFRIPRLNREPNANASPAPTRREPAPPFRSFSGYFEALQLRELRDAAMAAGVGSPEKRELLLVGIHRAITGALKLLPSPSDQLFTDLVRLNDIERLADGSVPILIWLDNAEDLAKPLPQAEIFRNARKEAAGSPRLNWKTTANQSPIRREPAPLTFRNNIVSRGSRPFVGRDNLLTRIARKLGDPVSGGVVVLHGQPGVGKSELALEFARRNPDRYSGGRFWVDASRGAVDIGLASIGKNILNLPFPSDLPLTDQGQQTFYSLGTAPVLLIYDNVVSFEQLERWMPLSGMPCQVLITTLIDRQNFTWHCIEVEALSREQSRELILQLTGPEFAAKYGGAIAAHADGLPVQILAETATLAYEVRRGRKPAPGATVTPEAGASFRRAYQRLEQPARLLLHAASLLHSQRIPRDELVRHMQEGIGWSVSDFERALDTCLDLHLLYGGPDPGMHQLFATFLKETQVSADDQDLLPRIREAQSARFVQIGRTLESNPADTQNAASLISYPLAPDAWEKAGSPFSIKECDTIGCALYEIGRFDEARPWHLRALAAIEKGDVHGRVDHASLGSSLHQVGDCLSRTGQYAEARPWFERAVAAKEKEDVHGRIDHASLGSSLHQAGYCLSRTGQYTEARPWFERAVAAKEKGDVHGRIDHESLGRSLHQVGVCLSSTGQYAEARPWFERAVAEAEKGDVHGRIDHESLSRSLNQVGGCLLSTGQYAEARPWFERAVVEAGKGDVHGRIDHESLGSSLHQVGDCLSSTGQHTEARPWFERAVAAKEKGDVHGRANHASLSITLRAAVACLRRLGQAEEANALDQRAAAADARASEPKT